MNSIKFKILPTVFAIFLMGCESTGALKEIGTKIQNQIGEIQKQATGTLSAEPEKLFEVIGASTSTFKDIFRDTKRPDLSSLDTGYPRVAVTYTDWGANMKCWKIRADIWKSASAHTTENVKVCDVPYVIKDDIGQAAQLTPVTLANIYNLLASDQSRSDWRNTGADRTIGPIPPKLTWKINIAGSAISGLPNEGDLLRSREEAIATRVALITGWHEYDKAAKNAAANIALTKDARLWFVKFDKKQP